VKREPTARPSTDSIDPIELSRCVVLAEQVDVVPQGRQRAAQARDVDVAPGPPKQVAVKYQNPDVAKAMSPRALRSRLR